MSHHHRTSVGQDHMTLNVAFQMDPIDRIDIGSDSTFALALEAQSRGHTLWYYLPKHLVQRDGKIGHGVFRVRHEDENLNALIDFFAAFVREPLMVQRYVPQVRQGDKRIILVDGEPAGAINRVPAQGEARSNMHVGGRPEKAVLTPREQEICRRIGPELKRRGLIFTGIDVIGDFITEINVTSPTGIWEVKRFGGADIAALVWDAIEKKRKG